MTTNWFERIVAILFLVMLGQPSSAAADRFGYVNCVQTEGSDSVIPVFAHPCLKQPVGVAGCGGKVRVISRLGQWLKIALPASVVGYVGIASVSKEAKSFIPFDGMPPMKPSLNSAECSIIRARSSPNQAPEMLVSAVEALDEYTELEAERTVDGLIVFVGRIGTDGRAHDVQIQLSMGGRLDEKARTIVENSKFAPALSDGRPVSSMVNFDVALRYTCIGGTARSTFCTPFLFVELIRKPY